VIVYIPPNSYVELLTPKVLGSGSLGVWLGQEDRILMNGISDLIFKN
jgi:hypothetical protein